MLPPVLRMSWRASLLAALLLAGVLATAARASAQEGWPMAGADAAHTATVEGPAPPYRVAWELDSEAAPVTGVAATETVVIVLTAEGVSALNADDGSVLWNRGRPKGPAGVPAIAGDLVLHARDEGASGQLAARDLKTGDLVWQATLGSAPTGGPTIAEDAVFVGTLAGEVVSLDLATGEERWRFETHGGVAGAPAVSDGVVVVASYQPTTGRSTVYGLDAETGAEDGTLWQFAGGAVGPPSAPSIADGRAFIGISDLQVRAFDLEDGAERWAFGSRDGFGPRQIPAAGEVLVLADRTHLYRLDPVTGEERWTWLLADLSPVSGNQVDTLLPSSPAISGRTVLLGSADGEISAIDIDSSRRVWRRDLGGGAAGPIAVTSERVFATSLGENGSLVALESDPAGSLLDEVSPTVLFVQTALLNFAGAAALVGLAIWVLFRFALRPRT